MANQLFRKDFSLGWQPNFDPVNAPPNALLRMDNCLLDEVGAIVKRPGSAKISPQTAAADADIHSLYTTYLYGTRYRFWGAEDAVYVNGTSTIPGFTGSGDMSFGAFLDEVFIARAATKKKYDALPTANATADWEEAYILTPMVFYGIFHFTAAWELPYATTLSLFEGPVSHTALWETINTRTWGIPAPAAPNQVVSAAPNNKVFSTCDSSESPGFTTPSEGTLSFANDWDGTPNMALQIVVDSATLRGMATKTFSAATDFTALSNGDVGTENDRISMHFYCADPKQLIEVIFMVDVSDGSFSQDFYSFTWKNQEISESTRNLLAGLYGAEFADRVSILDRAYLTFNPTSPFRPDLTSWSFISASRNEFTRTGLDGTKNWTTVKAIRVVIQSSGGTFRFDTIEISGGIQKPLDGKYKWRALYVLDNGKYQAKSEVSEMSKELEVLKGAAEVSVNNPGTSIYAADDVNLGKVEIWLYRMGGLMDGFYRTIRRKVTAQLGQEQIVDNLSDIDAMQLNIKLDTTNRNPPNGIIGIVSDYYDRLIVLTKTDIWPSRRLDPDSFSETQRMRIGDGTFVGYWIEQTADGVYIGTDKDILMLDGGGNEFPDGTTEFRLKPMNIGNPPISKAVAREGNVLVYLAADGWRLFNGMNSTPLGGDVSLLYKDYTRHGVNPVNISSRTARFRAVIHKGQLVAVTPEGSETTTGTIHRYDFAKQKWYRQTYGALGTNGWKAIFSEPDGTLVASDNNRNVWTLDTGTQDNATDIPITLWTRVDDDGTPDNFKDAHDFRAQLDTGGNNASFAMHKDGSQSATNTLTVSSNGFGMSRQPNTDLGQFTQVQLRITGSFATFRLLDYTLFYYLNPATRIVWDSGAIGEVADELFWMREIHLKVNAAANLTVTPYFDDTPSTALTVTVTTNKAKVYQVKLGRGVKGTVPRVKVTSASRFIPHWMDVIGSRSGMTQERIRIPA